MYCFLETMFFTTTKQLVNRHLIKLTHVLDIFHHHIMVQKMFWMLDVLSQLQIRDKLD